LLGGSGAVVIKRLFGKGSKDEEDEYTVDELMVLERYDEAAIKLRQQMKYKDQIHDHLKMADIYVGLKEATRAVDEYVYVAEQYAADGFYDRAIAALSKARKINPMDDRLGAKIERYEAAKVIERKRNEALEGFHEGQRAGKSKAASLVEFQIIFRALSDSPLVKKLDADQLRLFFQHCDIEYFSPGDVLARRGGREERLMVVGVGQIEARIEDRDGSSIQVRTLGPGQILGEGTLLEHRAWPAEYVVTEKTTVVVLEPDSLQACLVGNPDPRGFLDLLRSRGNDREVARLVQKIEGGGGGR
jgi:hypothetical protein